MSNTQYNNTIEEEEEEDRMVDEEEDDTCIRRLSYFREVSADVVQRVAPRNSDTILFEHQREASLKLKAHDVQ